MFQESLRLPWTYSGVNERQASSLERSQIHPLAQCLQLSAASQLPPLSLDTAAPVKEGPLSLLLVIPRLLFPHIVQVIIFFSLLFLVDYRRLFFFFLYLFSSTFPHRTAYSAVPSQMAAHPRIGSQL
jgi:hypothetical protein